MPHDSFFECLMSDPQNARAFLEGFLPGAILRHIDLSDLEIIDTKKTDRKYKRYLLDLCSHGAGDSREQPGVAYLSHT